MKRDEWKKEVLKSLIDKEMTISAMAVKMGRSPEWARLNIYGRRTTPEGVQAISDYLGIESYMESEE